MRMRRIAKAGLSLVFLTVWGCERTPDDEGAKITQRELAAAAPEGMVWIPGGEFLMGSNLEFAEVKETPPHTVRIKGFYMDETEVTNERFGEFIQATGYVTVAERPFDPADYPNADPEALKPGSLIFVKSEGPVPLDNHGRWWAFVAGANWRHPEGPGSTIEGKGDHPVVCVTWEDATSYAKWAGKRLPTEAEWEFAAKGGLGNDVPYAWGKTFKVDGKIPANLWQGEFPYENTAEDGFVATAAVKSYPPNGYGLYDMAGNVWEFVSDWYDPDYYLRSPEFNPAGPSATEAMDFNRRLRFESDVRESLRIVPHKVIRGGSFLCNDCYCRGYRPTARQTTDAITSTNHTGFRCVKSPRR